MKVSVIIPTYNRKDLLKETVDSILSQTYTDFELIIVDNFSEDGTEQFVKKLKDKRIRYFKHQNNGIIAVNRNYGIDKANGELIAFCDDDDLWYPEKLERQVKEFENNEQLGLVCTNGYTYDGKKLVRLMGKNRDNILSFERLIDENTIISSSVMVKKVALEELGKFDTSKDILTAEDYELWLRIASKYDVKYIGKPLIKYRIHPGMLQNTYLYGSKPLEIRQNVYKKLWYNNLNG